MNPDGVNADVGVIGVPTLPVTAGCENGVTVGFTVNEIVAVAVNTHPTP